METENPDTKPERETSKTEKQGGESQQGPAALPPVAEPTHSEAKVQDADKARDEADGEEEKAFKKLADAEEQQTKWERMQGEWTRIGAVTTAALSLLTFLLLFHQTCTLSKQLDAMQSSSKDTQEMIRAMQKQADASRDTAERQRDIVEQMGRQADATVNAADAATKQANASQTQANASVTQAEAAKQAVGVARITARAAERSAEIASVGERAVIFMKSMDVEGVEAERPIRFRVVFVNNGRIPAQNFYIETTAYWGRKPPPEPLNIGSPPNTVREQMFIAPQGTREIVFTHPGFSAAQTEHIREGRLLLYLFGRGQYEDAFGRTWVIEFCGKYVPNFTSMELCRTHNYTKQK
jgi:hypothetical protein